MKVIKKEAPTLKTIHDLCCRYFKLDNISKKTRQNDYVWSRYVFYRLALDEGYSLASIGNQAGGRDHATVLHGKRMFADLFNQLDFRIYKDAYLNLKFEINSSKDENCNLSDFLLRFKEEIKEMDGTDYLFFKAQFLKSLGNHVEARNQKNIAISRETAPAGAYIFSGGETV
jgi:hypothetical protein